MTTTQHISAAACEGFSVSCTKSIVAATLPSHCCHNLLHVLTTPLTKSEKKAWIAPLCLNVRKAASVVAENDFIKGFVSVSSLWVYLNVHCFKGFHILQAYVLDIA